MQPPPNWVGGRSVPMGATLCVVNGAAHEAAMAASRGAASRPPPPPVSLPSPSRPAKVGRRRFRTNGRMGFELDYDPHAARRTVDIPEAKSVNRMKVFGSPALGIPISDAKRLRGLVRRAAADFVTGERQTFRTQSWDVLEKAITRLELDEPRLAVCVRSWGACALLSRTANNAADYAVQVAGQSWAAPPAAAAESAASESLPPPLAAPNAAGASAGALAACTIKRGARGPPAVGA